MPELALIGLAWLVGLFLCVGFWMALIRLSDWRERRRG